MSKVLTNNAWIAGAVGLAFVLSFALGFTTTQAEEDLQAQIDQLLQQIAQLEAQLDGEATPSGGLTPMPAGFETNMAPGSTGENVRQLQQWLNENGFQVAASGPGSPGNETTYFGSLTQGAVGELQDHLNVAYGQYRGYWGPATRAAVRAYDPAPVDPVDPVDPVNDEVNDEPNDEPANDEPNDEPTPGFEITGQEGSIDDFEVHAVPSDEELGEGQTEEVMAFGFEAGDSDLRVERISLLVEGNTDFENTDRRPWRYMDEVALLDSDGNVLASRSAGSSGNWSEVGGTIGATGTSRQVYRMRFTGFEDIVREGDEASYTIEVAARGTLDTGRTDASFEFAIKDSSADDSDDGVRAVDQAGINQFGGSDDTVTATFIDQDSGSLTLKTAVDEIKEDFVKVDESSRTNDVPLMRFRLEAEDQDIEVEDIVASTTIANDTEGGTVLRNLKLYANGTLIKTKSSPNTGGHWNSSNGTGDGTATTTFDSIDYVISQGDTVTFEIRADINDTDGGDRYDEGTTVTVGINAGIDSIVSEEASGDLATVTSPTNSVEGETQHLRTVVPQLSFIGQTLTVTGDNDELVDGTLTFSVTADGDDIYVAGFEGSGYADSTPDLDSLGAGAGTLIAHNRGDGGLSTSATSTWSADIETNADVAGSGNEGWVVRDGDTEEFEISVLMEGDADADDSRVNLRFTLNDVRWALEESNLTGFSDLSDIPGDILEDFKTSRNAARVGN